MAIREGSNVHHPDHGSTYVVLVYDDGTCEIADPVITGKSHVVPVDTLTLDSLDAALQAAEDDVITCTCCDVHNYSSRPGDDECPRCGHLYKRHGGQ